MNVTYNERELEAVLKETKTYESRASKIMIAAYQQQEEIAMELKDEIFVHEFRYKYLEKQIGMLLEELEAAPPLPMKSNIDFWYGMYDTWRDKALAECAVCREGLDNGK